jgi:hypothetical protein
MTDTLEFYTKQSLMTDPGEYASLYDGIPDDFQSIADAIHNVLIHHDDATNRYQPTGIQRREVFMRTMKQRFKRIMELDPSPLMVPRIVKEKQLGYCRDYAVFMTSILRYKGIPARVRAGFGAYINYDPLPPYRGDHWITEYWDPTEARWRLIDAEFAGEDLEFIQDRVKYPFRKGIDFFELRANEDFFLAPWGLARLADDARKLTPRLPGS